LFAAAFVKGVQSQKIAATVKHFCCNNKEANRMESDSRISQRALREIYLRGFEIAVKTAKPWAVMTAYNLVNGQRSTSNWEAITGILQGEWHYEGLVMTDWCAHSVIDAEIRAGSHVKMPNSIPNSPAHFDFDKAIADGLLTRENLLYGAKKVLEFMAHFE
jgi:beta-glucosidase